MKKMRRDLSFLIACGILMLMPVLISGQNDPADIPYDDCGGSDSKEVVSIRLTGCDEDEICQITMGDILTLKVKWKTQQTAIRKLKSNLQVQFFKSFRIDVDLVPLDACQYLKCPITKNTDVRYVANFTVPTNIISASNGRIWWKIYETSEDDPLLCVNFQVKINYPR